jgi:hypothetical protein
MDQAVLGLAMWGHDLRKVHQGQVQNTEFWAGDPGDIKLLTTRPAAPIDGRLLRFPIFVGIDVEDTGSVDLVAQAGDATTERDPGWELGDGELAKVVVSDGLVPGGVSRYRCCCFGPGTN